MPKLIGAKKSLVFNKVSDAATARLRRYQNSSNRLRIVRSFSAPSHLDVGDQVNFIQALASLTQHYDEVILAIKPDREIKKNPQRFLKTLAGSVVKQPWQDKIIFEFQAQDEHHEWVDGAVLKSWMQTSQQFGIRNLAYFPDDFIHDQPAFSAVFGGISLNQFPPFYKEPTAKLTIDRKAVTP